MVTGQLVFREAGTAPTNDGRKLMMVVGLIAVPQDFICKDEHQYTVEGQENGELKVHAETASDITSRSRGQTIGNLLKLPIWRC